jgi:hypothetical protein
MSVAQSKINGPRTRMKKMRRYMGQLEKWLNSPTSGFPYMTTANILLLLAHDYVLRQANRLREAKQ